MFVVHVYACSCLGLLVLIILARHVSTVSSTLQKLEDLLPLPSIITHFVADESLNFGLHMECRIPFLVFLLVSHGLVLAIGLDAPYVQALISRASVLLLVDIDGLLLLSNRHSLLIDLAADYQPGYLWAHSMLGVFVVMESLMILGLMIALISESKGKISWASQPWLTWFSYTYTLAGAYSKLDGFGNRP